jgi:DNA (cytosine-5)-methyltransferase 1
MTNITFGSLFAGIGGIDLGFERAGMTCKWQVEIDDYARRVLAKHWPDVRRWDDVRTWPQQDTERVDVIAGGFPCQDISYAGKGAGLAGSRSGLFYEAMRIVSVVGPRIVVLENVAALLTRGMGDVLGTLASLGYDAEWHCIPAAAVGAPHIRDRVFIVAYAEGQRESRRSQVTKGERPRGKRPLVGLGTRTSGGNQPRYYTSRSNKIGGYRIPSSEAVLADTNEPVTSEERIQRGGQFLRIGCDNEANQKGVVSDANSTRLQGQRQISGRTIEEFRNACYESWWETEPAVGRVANGIPKRLDRLKGLGNAVVPQVAELIGRLVVQKMESMNSG